LGNRFVARAGEDRKAWVFGVGGIGGGALAKEERGAFGGFDGAGVEARGAKARGEIRFWRRVRAGHGCRIARAGPRRKMERYTPESPAEPTGIPHPGIFCAECASCWEIIRR